jgi:hypothetical protein
VNGSSLIAQHHAGIQGQLQAGRSASAGRAGARPVIVSLISHSFRAAASSRAAADGSRRWRLT